MNTLKIIIKRITTEEHNPTSEIKFVLNEFLKQNIGNSETVLEILKQELKEI